MLHVEQPDSRRPCKTQHRKLDQEVRSPSNKPVGNQNHDDDEQVGEKNTHSFFSLHPSRRKPVSEQKHEQCTQIACTQFLSFSLKNQVGSEVESFYYHI